MDFTERDYVTIRDALRALVDGWDSTEEEGNLLMRIDDYLQEHEDAQRD